MNDEPESCFGSNAGHPGGEDRSPDRDCPCRPRTADDLAARESARVARQARLARGQWTDAGAGLQVRLA